MEIKWCITSEYPAGVDGAALAVGVLLLLLPVQADQGFLTNPQLQILTSVSCNFFACSTYIYKNYDSGSFFLDHSQLCKGTNCYRYYIIIYCMYDCRCVQLPPLPLNFYHKYPIS